MSNKDTAITLLVEWFKYWRDSDDMPAKMPNSLHTRTVTFLTVHEFETGEAYGLHELREEPPL